MWASLPIVGLSRFDLVASGAEKRDHHLRQFNVPPLWADVLVVEAPFARMNGTITAHTNWKIAVRELLSKICNLPTMPSN
jgi:hypothetical protein